jgi:hypothetical protein
MIFYMVRDNLTGLFYKRSYGCGPEWVTQQKASVWTQRQGPGAAIKVILDHNKHTRLQREPEEIVILA